MSWDCRPLTREEFTTVPLTVEDGFAKTFRMKADAFDLWSHAVGCFDGKTLGAAIILRRGKRNPITANLELLHTFALHRRQGLAKKLVLEEYSKLYRNALYFRVSSEAESVDFYRALGFRFWGRQKSGCLLCMHAVGGSAPTQAKYDPNDPVILRAVLSGRKGGCVERFEELL